MTSTWLPVVGERIRPVETAAEAVSPGGDPIPAPDEGPHSVSYTHLTLPTILLV